MGKKSEAGFEYGVMMRGIEGLHRGPWTKEEAEEWIREWDDEIQTPQQESMRGLFYVVRRPVGEWERV